MRRRAEICEAQAPLLTQSQSLALVIRHPRPISSKQLIGAQTIAVSLARGRRACALETERKAGWLAPRSWTGRGDWNMWAWSLLPLRQESFSFLLIRALPVSLCLSSSFPPFTLLPLPPSALSAPLRRAANFHTGVNKAIPRSHGAEPDQNTLRYPECFRGGAQGAPGQARRGARAQAASTPKAAPQPRNEGQRSPRQRAGLKRGWRAVRAWRGGGGGGEVNKWLTYKPRASTFPSGRYFGVRARLGGLCAIPDSIVDVTPTQGGGHAD